VFTDKSLVLRSQRHGIARTGNHPLESSGQPLKDLGAEATILFVQEIGQISGRNATLGRQLPKLQSASRLQAEDLSAKLFWRHLLGNSLNIIGNPSVSCGMLYLS
jgi:hypothetical protein